MQYFVPFVGRGFDTSHLMVLGESAYSWYEEGELKHPSPNHASEMIDYIVANFPKVTRFQAAITRTLSGKENPSSNEIRIAWERIAFTNFVQGTIGAGAGTRPNSNQWIESRETFFSTLEKLRPKKILVTGIDLWRSMPDSSLHLSNDIQAYELSDKQLVWCLAVSHPANRTVGFDWQLVHDSLKLFEQINWPDRIPS